MHLTRCQDQSHETLDGFYTEDLQSDDPFRQSLGKTMLDLIARLRALPDERRVYGLTSHWHLCLLATDTGQSPWFVKVVATDRRNYHVSYRMPERLAPWRWAYVHGDAESEDEAVRMILIAMDWSGGWSQLGGMAEASPTG
jgi:hypothetical protein